MEFLVDLCNVLALKRAGPCTHTSPSLFGLWEKNQIRPCEAPNNVVF